MDLDHEFGEETGGTGEESGMDGVDLAKKVNGLELHAQSVFLNYH